MHPFLDYDLPPDRIAQQPAAERDLSKLMVLRRASAEISHCIFRDLPDLLNPGDLLVLNDTRVLPARLIGLRDKTGGKWEGLFLHRTADGLWEMLCQTKGKPDIGESFSVECEPSGSGFQQIRLHMILHGKADGHWLMKPDLKGSPLQLLHKFGHMPLPPYIRKGKDEPADRERYQTIFARADGSVAAPTAGLHFTPALFKQLAERGINRKYLTLHVGLGTFEPIREEDPGKHVMHHEWASVSYATMDAIRKCKIRGGRVIAVGTTTTRALEWAAQTGELQLWRGETNLFIKEPYTFRVIDGLLTNFHLPRTTLLLLVGAFAGSELLRRAYAEAIAQGYRFYSYGDVMLIL
jgi:S-adenosylmethionine:tRNA ribosyltransferase-isomerase